MRKLDGTKKIDDSEPIKLTKMLKIKNVECLLI